MSFALQARMKEIETVFDRVVELQRRVAVLEKQAIELREMVRPRTISEIAEDRVRPRLMAKHG